MIAETIARGPGNVGETNAGTSSRKADRAASMEHLDNYAQLELPRSATSDQIKSAYRRLARNCHPDTCPDADAEPRFIRLYEAYACLIDQARRGEYDQDFPSAGLSTDSAAYEPPSWWFAPIDVDTDEAIPTEGESGRVRVGPHIVVRSVRWVMCRHCAGSGGSEGICGHCQGLGSVARRTDVPVWARLTGHLTGQRKRAVRKRQTGPIHAAIWGVVLCLFVGAAALEDQTSRPRMVASDDDVMILRIFWCLVIATALVISWLVEIADE